MATDSAAILRNLEACYDVTGRSVIHVGAGGGPLAAFAARARDVLRVDPAGAAVARRPEPAPGRGPDTRSRVVTGDLRTVSASADVVFFEFCLHEIVDPFTALWHAARLAPEVLIVDWAPGSAWAWQCCEAEKVLRGWAAAERFARSLDRSFAGAQRFRDHAELLAAVRALGECATRRAEEFRGRRDFRIAMPYRVALLAG